SRQQAVQEKTRLQTETAEHLKQWGEELTAARVQLGQVQEKQLACQQHVQRLTGQQAELAQQIERVVSSAESLSSRRDAVQRELSAAQEQERELEQQQKELAEQMNTLAGRVEELGGQVRLRSGRGESARRTA